MRTMSRRWDSDRNHYSFRRVSDIEKSASIDVRVSLDGLDAGMIKEYFEEVVDRIIEYRSWVERAEEWSLWERRI